MCFSVDKKICGVWVLGMRLKIDFLFSVFYKSFFGKGGI